MNGRPPLSIAHKRARGDTRKIGANKFAATTSSALEAARGRPEMPSCLQAKKGDPKKKRDRLAIARKHWEYLADELDRANRLATLDEGMLTTISLAYALMVEAATSSDWRTRRLYPELYARYMQATDRMGLNEAARVRIPAPPRGDEDELDQAIGPRRI